MTCCIIVDRFYSSDEVSSSDPRFTSWHHNKTIHDFLKTTPEMAREEAIRSGYDKHPYRFRIVRHAWPDIECESPYNPSLYTSIKSNSQ